MRQLVAVLVLGTLAVASAQNQCLLDDYITRVQDMQVNGGVNEVAGPCPGDLGYQGNNFGIATQFSVLNNSLAGSYCIGFIVDTDSTNAAALAYFHEFPTFAIVGSINITSNTLTYSIRGASATFSVGDTSGYHHYQLCVNATDVTLYENCSVPAQQSFSHAGFTDNDTFSLLRDFNKETYIYMNAVSQFYFLSCSGPNVTQDEMANVQCTARNPVCEGNPSISVTAAVAQYVTGLNLSPTSTTEQPPVNQTTSPTTPTVTPEVDSKADREVLCVSLIAVSLLCGLALLYG